MKTANPVPIDVNPHDAATAPPRSLRLARSIGRRLAWRYTDRIYRRPIVGDVPRNGIVFKLAYGDPRKYWNYAKLLRSFRKQQLTVAGMPSELHVDPANACNLRCPLCATGVGEVDRPPGLMSVEMFDEVLRKFGAHTFCLRVWGWGEPLMNRKVWDMVRLAEDRGVGTEISSNLSLKISDAHIDAMIASGLTWLTISADGASPETYARYRLRGDFRLVMANLHRIAERKQLHGSKTPFLEWQFVPLRHNEHEMPRAREIYRDLGADGLRFKPARVDKTRHLSFNGEEPPAELLDWMPSDPDLYHAVDEQTHAYLPLHCPSLWRSASVHYDGAIAMCCETYETAHDVGRLEKDFQALWNGETYRNARRVALGIDLTDADSQLPCYNCKVFHKPHHRPH